MLNLELYIDIIYLRVKREHKPRRKKMTKAQKKDKFEVCRTGPGSLTGQKFTSLTEALRFAGHLLREGTACSIRPLKIR
jgi:hypothetical protein